MRRRLICAAALAAALSAPASSAASSISVNTTADEFDNVVMVPGAGCSLREAVQAANTNGAFGGCSTGEPGSPDVITLPAGTYGLHLAGAGENLNATGDLDVSTGGGVVQIAGAGAGTAIIDGLTLDRVLDVKGNAGFGLSGVTVRSGGADGVDAEARGGAIRWETGTGSLSVADSVFSGNFAGAASAIRLASTGSHSITDSVIADNVGHDLGAISSDGPLTLTRTAVIGNNGGGVRVTGGLTAPLSVLNSTIANNLPGDAGPGAIAAEGNVTVTNSTINNNIGGFVGALTTPGDVTVRFSTITENRAPGSGVGGSPAGGIDSFSANSVLIEGSVLARNFNGLTPSDCNDAAKVTEGTSGPNLEDQNTCGLEPPSVINADPQLAPLADNGGATPTRGLYPGSPALDLAAAPCGFSADQRGSPRPASGPGACDLGAFEGTVPRPVVPTPTDPGSPAKTVKCKAKIPRCCTKKQRVRGRPAFCKKKRNGRVRRLDASQRLDAAPPEVIGRSAQGRPIVATRLGDPDAERVALVVGVIHGNERAGLHVIADLKRSWADVKGVQLWVVKSVNPDGQRARTRKNAHGVDLNRNFPFRWRGGVPPSNGYYPGPSPASEPETRAMMGFVDRIQPDVSIWYHQPWGAVLACKGTPAVGARYSNLSGLGTSCQGRGLHGTAISWENDEVPGSSAFVVEFPGGSISDHTARRHARAAAIIARDG